MNPSPPSRLRDAHEKNVKHFYAKNECFLNGSQIKRILLNIYIYIIHYVNELAVYKTMFVY